MCDSVGMAQTVCVLPPPTRAFHSVDDLQNAIKRYIDAHNSDCRPFVWTSSAKAIFEKLAQVPCTFCLSRRGSRLAPSAARDGQAELGSNFSTFS